MTGARLDEEGCDWANDGVWGFRFMRFLDVSVSAGKGWGESGGIGFMYAAACKRYTAVATMNCDGVGGSDG